MQATFTPTTNNGAKTGELSFTVTPATGDPFTIIATMSKTKDVQIAQICCVTPQGMQINFPDGATVTVAGSGADATSAVQAAINVLPTPGQQPAPMMPPAQQAIN